MVKFEGAGVGNGNLAADGRRFTPMKTPIKDKDLDRHNGGSESGP